MDDYHLLVTYVDFYGVWKKKIQPSLIHEGPLLINLELGVENGEDEDRCPYFSPKFIESEDGDALCQLFIIPYDSKFDTNQTTEINIWRSKHPGKAFLVLILSIARSQWSFTTQRSKIESMFNSIVPTSRVVIAKYYLDKEESISESDLRSIHISLANLIQISNQDRIKVLQQQLNDIQFKSEHLHSIGNPEKESEIDSIYTSDYVKVSNELASLYHTFGFLSQSILIYRSIISVINEQAKQHKIPFWPPSPQKYDIRRFGTKVPLNSGYCMIISSIHGIVKSLIQTNSMVELSKDVTRCFSLILAHSTTAEQMIFARSWIHFTAINLSDAMENAPYFEGQENHALLFQMIALNQILKLLEYSTEIEKAKNKSSQEITTRQISLTASAIFDFETSEKLNTLNFDVDLNIPFLENIMKDHPIFSDQTAKEQLFLLECTRAEKLAARCFPNHRAFVSSLFFEFFLNNDDITGAMASLQNTSLSPDCPINQLPIETESSEYLSSSELLEHKKSKPAYRKNKRRTGRPESHVLELLFSYEEHRNEEIAELLISCIGAKNNSKIEALKFLALLDSEIEVRPDFSISPLLFSPSLFETHDIYDTIHLKLSFKIPHWIISLFHSQPNQEQIDLEPNFNDSHLLSRSTENDSNLIADDYNSQLIEDENWFHPHIWIQLSSNELSDDFCLISEPKQYDALEHEMIIEEDINCNFAGKFQTMILIMKFGNCYLVWQVPMPHELIIIEKNAAPTFDLLMPCLLQRNCLQSAVFSAKNLDASSTEVTFMFEMDGLEEIIYLKPCAPRNTESRISNAQSTFTGIGSPKRKSIARIEIPSEKEKSPPTERRKSQPDFLPISSKHHLDSYKEIHYKPNMPIILQQFDSMIQMKLIYRMKMDDTVGVIYSYVRRDGTSHSITQQFAVPEIKSFNIRLFKQTAKLQQFQIVNIFPQKFEFIFNNKKHEMPPQALYSIVRNASDLPLDLTFFEEGWEDYPVEVSTSNFKLDKMTVKLTVQEKKRNIHQAEMYLSDKNEAASQQDLIHKNDQSALNPAEEVIPKPPSVTESDWIVGEPRLVIVDPPALPMMEDEKNWVIAPQDSEGITHIFIPKRPGKLPFPKFQVKQQVAEPIPKVTEIKFNGYPPMVPL